MAKIKESDIFEGNIFEQNAKSASDLLDVVIQLQKAGKAKLPLVAPESSEEINELTENLKKLELQRKIGVEQRKIEQEQQKKAREADKKELDAYQKKSKELNELRKRYKALAVEQGVNSKEVKKLAKEVEKLDKELKEVDASAGQFQRNVGNYPKVVDGAKNSFKSLGTFLFGFVVGAFGKSRAEAREFQGAITKLQSVLNVFVQAFFISITKIVIPTLKKWGLQLESTKEFLKGNFAESKRLSEQAEELGKEIDKVQNPFKGLGEVISETNELISERLKLQDRLIDQGILIEANIARLTGLEEQAAVIIGDNTSSFEAQRKAVEEVLKLQGQRIAQSLKLAKIQQNIAILQAEEELTAKQVFKGLNEIQKQELLNRVKNLDFLNDKNLADKVSVETLEALKTATLGVIDLENQRATFLKQQDKERRQIKLDEFEQELDILLDAFDNQKTINERIIADEEIVFSKRRDLLNRTKELNRQNAKEQEDLFREQTGLQIDLNDLVATDDQQLLKEKLFFLDDLVEIERKRLLEAIRDQRTANQDLKDAERDLNNSIVESRKRRFESLREIERINGEFTIAQNERRFEKELQQQEQADIIRTQKLKEFIKLNEGQQLLLLQAQKRVEQEEANEIVDERERNAKLLEIERKYQNEFFALNQDTFDKIADLEEKARISRVEFAENLFNDIRSIAESELDAIEELEQQSFERRQAQRDKDIDLQRQRAVNGQKNTFAELEALRIQEELKRQQQERRDARRRQLIKDVEVFTEAYLTNLKVPNTTSEKALLKTAQDQAKFKALTAVVGGLFSAKDGTEDTGKGGSLDKDGGFLAKLHPNERVLTKEQNEPLLKMGVKNADLPDLVALGVMAKTTMPNLMQSIRLNSKDILATKIDELKEVIENKTEYRDFTDKHGNHIAEMITKGNKRVVKYQRAKPRF
jgi:hypothetical protein